ncbi:MAG TPA: hypothetical protein VMY06_03530 [Sedimentisphaerales bacterium]|nr:hypothetical protein [Sedimentisphaerales bacterium]
MSNLEGEILRFAQDDRGGSSVPRVCAPARRTGVNTTTGGGGGEMGYEVAG